ncbi:MAG: hypothetical protein AVDCRST_MAG35-839, partial [uncultured Quadrisphaera sp.]
DPAPAPPRRGRAAGPGGAARRVRLRGLGRPGAGRRRPGVRCGARRGPRGPRGPGAARDHRAGGLGVGRPRGGAALRGGAPGPHRGAVPRGRDRRRTGHRLGRGARRGLHDVHHLRARAGPGAGGAHRGGHPAAGDDPRRGGAGRGPRAVDRRVRV